MRKYAKVINEETKACEVGLGTNTAFYQSIGMVEMEVEQAYDGSWYIEGYAPNKPEPTKEEIQALRSDAYKEEIDPITCHIQRLGDEEQTAEVITEIAALVEERKAKVAEIKARYPYPAEPVVEEPEQTVAEPEPVVDTVNDTVKVTEEPLVELAEGSDNEVVELYSMEI